MRKVAVYTDFSCYDPSYSLCSVAQKQIKMLRRAGYAPRMLVRQGFDANSKRAYPGAEFVEIETPYVGNTIEITDSSSGEIEHLNNQIRSALEGFDVVLTHDMLCQAVLWKDRIAAARLAREREDILWLHWVHSGSSRDMRQSMGRFRMELMGSFHNSLLVVFHDEERFRKAKLFEYDISQTVMIPNPMDLTEHYHRAAQMAIEDFELERADAIAVYPCRLDRGKQVEVVVEIMAALRAMGYDAHVVVVDFSSWSRDESDDKMIYREELLGIAKAVGVSLHFTSSLNYPDAKIHLPHEAVMDLFDYSDIFIHPSTSEADPLVLQEAMWKGKGLLLNLDLPPFRQYQGRAMFGQFSSDFNVITAMPGNITTTYDQGRNAYMRDMASQVAFMLNENPVIKNHVLVRRGRSLGNVWDKHLGPAIEGAWR